MYIRKQEVYQYGPTEGCPGCNAVRQNLPSRNHSEKCRDRMMTKMNDDEEGRARLEAEKVRIIDKLTKETGR